MKRFLTFLAFALVLLAAPAIVFAQDVEATPTPNPLVYDDAAMHVEIPATFTPVARRSATLDDLTDDPLLLAVWRSKTAPQEISLYETSFEASPDSWESSYENQLRGQFDDVLIRGKDPIRLKNGMPAFFVNATYGSGFGATKMYAVIWADGVRGMVLAINARVGQVSEKEARAALSDVSAVVYPKNR